METIWFQSEQAKRNLGALYDFIVKEGGCVTLSGTPSVPLLQMTKVTGNADYDFAVNLTTARADWSDIVLAAALGSRFYLMRVTGPADHSGVLLAKCKGAAHPVERYLLPK
jgi:hypothetical protein